MPKTQERTRRAFWWEQGRPAGAAEEPLRAVLFNLDGALADLHRDGHRVACNAAFAAHGLAISWDVEQYRHALCIGDEQRRIAAALRRHGYGRASAELAAQVRRTKDELFEECVLDGDVAPRPGLADLVTSLFVAGIDVAVVSTGARSWVEPLARQLIGDGIAATVVSRDDLTVLGPQPDVYGHALWELGLPPERALAVAGSVTGLRAAIAAKLTTLVMTTPYTVGHDFAGAAAVRHHYDEPEPLRASGCEALHRRWLAVTG
ncbi:HAD family hydrolase [Mycolicibacterium thermoresistibile]